jgi:hypothetical protein
MLNFKKNKSKFEFNDNRSFKEKLFDFLQSLLFWRGRQKGMIRTRNIHVWEDFKYIFFPSGFSRYGYLGTHLWNKNGACFNALYPLVLALDYEAKPKWCPRWFLRFLHVFGSDKSIVRVRNQTLYKLKQKLTKGIAFVDWKLKWSNYDLRISIHAPSHLQDLADDIEHGFYSRGKQKELVAEIKKLDPNARITWGSIKKLEEQLMKLEETEKLKQNSDKNSK